MNQTDRKWKIAIPKAFGEPHPLFYARGISHIVEDRVSKVPWRTRLLYRWHALATILRYLVTGYCGYGGCGYVEPYGFVPEAGCPVHDSDSWLSRWIRKVRKGKEQAPWRVWEL